MSERPLQGRNPRIRSAVLPIWDLRASTFHSLAGKTPTRTVLDRLVALPFDYAKGERAIAKGKVLDKPIQSHEQQGGSLTPAFACKFRGWFCRRVGFPGR
jgi:hypothetical protein